MWFRNLRLFKLAAPFTLAAEDLDQHLQAERFTPCGGLQTQSLGWVSPLGPDFESLVHAANGCLMVCMRREERILPAAVVREELAERVREIEAKEARQVRRKEQQKLKDDIVHELLPRAFTRSTHLYAYIDPRNGWVVVDAATAKKAEELVSLLRQALGSLQARPFDVQQSPVALMTGWLTDGAPGEFDIGDECELREPVEGGSVLRCRHQDLQADEIQGHLEAGKRVTQLAVTWDERLSCVLSDDVSIKRLRFLDVVMDEAAEVSADDAVARFDADFALLSLELSRFIPAWLEAFGGLAATSD
jgi:recombination associated protein RdgC